MNALSNVWPRYRDNTARHLIGIARDLQQRSLHHLTEVRGYRSLRPSLGPLLSLVALAPRPLGAIAAQFSISPQAASQLVNIGEAAGYLERQPDPTDRRTRLVALTDLGRALVADSVEILLEFEADYRALVGIDEYAEFTRILSDLFRGLGIRTHTNLSVAAPTSQSLGVLPLISVRIQKDLMYTTIDRGHSGLKMSHAQVLPLIGTDGARVHQLARVQRMSRQAISATARDLEELGYLRRDADPLDRRGVVFRLTGLGSRLIQDSVASLDKLETAFREILGTAPLEALQSISRNLYQALHLEEEIFETRAESSSLTIDQSRSIRIPAEPEPELEQLAARLKRQLGARGAERLAALLEARN
jgi:DNA-binding MarR family transcriptional regulator